MMTPALMKQKIPWKFRIARGLWIGCGLVLIGMSGCHTPMLMPVAPIEISKGSDGTIERRYDSDGDRRIDYVERLGTDGRVAAIRVDMNRNGTLDDVLLDQIKQSDCRHLVILLDSIPFDIVKECREQGRFRFFHPPSRLISTFPAVTDVAISEFMNLNPIAGVEVSYYDGQRLTPGWGSYVREDNSGWLSRFDHYVDYDKHGFIYYWPQSWLMHELWMIQQGFLPAEADRVFWAYIVSTSAEGAQYGENGHRESLLAVDRLCQMLMMQTQGKLQITLLSDHGQDTRPYQYVDFGNSVERLGYRVVERIERPGDVVLPAFAVVSYAGIYTNEPQRVAKDVVGLECVDLAMYRNGEDEVVVVGRSGQARITRRDDRYRYQMESGDPLVMGDILQRFRSTGVMDEPGFVDDKSWEEATADHVYPDAVHRIWRAFHGLVRYPPDVLVSLKDGWYCGSWTMDKMIRLHAVHGSLTSRGSVGFVMSTAGSLPPSVRIESLQTELDRLGFPAHRRPEPE